MGYVRDSSKHLQLLSELLLTTPFSRQSVTEEHATPSFETSDHGCELAGTLGPKDFDSLKALASTNHVVMRAFPPLQQILESQGKHEAVEWIDAAIQEEAARITHALGFLAEICSTLEEGSCPVTVIKSLD